jgi:A/G-specific adenine glycosylase
MKYCLDFCYCLYIGKEKAGGESHLALDSVILLVRQALLDWFKRFGRSSRDLPWRKNYDPYHVWISEIMLQQTQMDRGVVFFKRWVERFPDVGAVAMAPEREILKYWEGLGYYTRARNLHKAARIIVDQHQEKIPESYDSLLALPGIGSYTASAITSIAYNQDVAVVDANVERIFTRLFDINRPLKDNVTKKRIHKLAGDLLPSGEARIFNQALMDLGGLICTPKKPLCLECPLAGFCVALSAGHVHERSVLTGTKKTIPIEMVTGVLEDLGLLFIQQRLANDVWGSLWEFPGGRLEDGETPEEALVREYREETGFSIVVLDKITTIIHHYMNYKVILHCFRCRFTKMRTDPVLSAAQNCRWVNRKELAQYGFPAGHRKLIEYMYKS